MRYSPAAARGSAVVLRLAGGEERVEELEVVQQRVSARLQVLLLVRGGQRGLVPQQGAVHALLEAAVCERSVDTTSDRTREVM